MVKYLETNHSSCVGLCGSSLLNCWAFSHSYRPERGYRFTCILGVYKFDSAER